MDSKEYWDMVAKEKEFTTPFQLEIFKKYVNKDSKILDIGCGYGRVLKELYDNGYHDLLGIDFSIEMINRGKELYPYINFYQTTGNSLEFDDNSVDCVVVLAVLTCIYDKNKQLDFIKEIYRILKEDGIIYINDFLLNESTMYLERYDKYSSKYQDYGVFETIDGGVFRHHSINYFHDLLSSFKCEEEKVLKYRTMNGHISNGIYYIGRK